MMHSDAGTRGIYHARVPAEAAARCSDGRNVLMDDVEMNRSVFIICIMGVHVENVRTAIELFR